MTLAPIQRTASGLFLFLSILLPVCASAESEGDNAEQGVILPGLERSEVDPVIKGLVLLEDLNCVACHASDAPFADRSRKAPRLSDIGSRVHPEYLETLLLDPHGTKPGTAMPDLLGSLEGEERKKTAGDLVHFLLSLKPNRFSLQAPDSVAAAKGERLFHSRGCVACHSPRDGEGNELLSASSAPLGDLERKYSIESLVRFLKDPLRVRPSGRMPHMNLPTREVEQIAHYLLRKTQVPGSLHYTLYRGRVWEGLESDSVTAERAGLVGDFSLESLGTLSHQTAIVYRGWIDLPETGDYGFHLRMNGGELRIDGKEIVSEEPSNRRGPKDLHGSTRLGKGLREISLTYFHTGREPSFSFAMKAPGEEGAPVASSRLTSSREPVASFEPWVVDEGAAVSGREQFRVLGCANCHDDVGVRPMEWVGFSELSPDQGCLDGEAARTPRFSLSGSQRAWINAVLPNAENLRLETYDQIGRAMVSLNCIGCHERTGVGDIAPEREAYFTTTRPELGNQGRIPPPLSHVGAKLTPGWMKDVLLHGKRQRGYVDASMPQYGEANLGGLIEWLGEVDRLEDVILPEVTDILESKNAGYEMIGAEGFGCIACHDYNGQEAGGAGALDIVHLTERLRKNWFHLYMRNPQRFHSTVIMPNYWPGGQSVRPRLLDGDPARQIEALWNYLEDGPRARKPKGLSRQSNEIRVGNVAEIVRGRGTAGYRGIGVGYPERVNLAFDSEEMALRVLWKGDFASVNHGSFRAIGSNRISLPPGIPFHRLESLDDDWPYKRKTDYLFPGDHGYQFRGYSLDGRRRPTFRYRYGEISVEEFFEDRVDEDGSTWFRRVLRWDAPTAGESFYFRAAAGSAVKQVSENRYAVDSLEIAVPSSSEVLVRDGDPAELLLPITLPAGQTELILEYRW